MIADCPSSGRGWRAAWILTLLLAAANGSAAELRPTVSAGVADIVSGHASFGAALRLQIVGPLFVQGDYVALRGDGHTDHGPTLLVGLSGGNRDGLRPFAGVGGGPVKGYAGDDDMTYLAIGAAHPLRRGSKAFLQAELRIGRLGESTYRQFTVGVGVSR